MTTKPEDGQQPQHHGGCLYSQSSLGVLPLPTGGLGLDVPSVYTSTCVLLALVAFMQLRRSWRWVTNLRPPLTHLSALRSLAHLSTSCVRPCSHAAPSSVSHRYPSVCVCTYSVCLWGPVSLPQRHSIGFNRCWPALSFAAPRAHARRPSQCRSAPPFLRRRSAGPG